MADITKPVPNVNASNQRIKSQPHLSQRDSDREARFPGVLEVPDDQRYERRLDDEDDQRAGKQDSKVLVDKARADDEADTCQEERRKYIAQLRHHNCGQVSCLQDSNWQTMRMRPRGVRVDTVRPPSIPIR